MCVWCKYVCVLCLKIHVWIRGGVVCSGTKGMNSVGVR